jgi:hypothetical protein
MNSMMNAHGQHQVFIQTAAESAGGFAQTLDPPPASGALSLAAARKAIHTN